MRQLGLLAAILLATAGATQQAHAASCNGASHAISLTAGGATPGSGTTTTAIKFSVTYADTAGCAPGSVTVTVAGVGTRTLAAGGTSYQTGVTYATSLTLPAGNHAYSFAAVSGSGAGLVTATLTTVTPTVVVISAPTPTPAPTTRTTPVPPPPPPQPVVTPTPSAPNASPVPTAGSAAPVSPTPLASPGNRGPVGNGTPARRSPLAGVIAASASTPGPGAAQATLVATLYASGIRLILTWALLTIGGLLLFALLMVRGGRRGAQRTMAMAPVSAVGQAPGGVPARDAGPEEPNAPLGGGDLAGQGVPAGERNMPRWLRPSVQAARKGIAPGHDD